MTDQEVIDNYIVLKYSSQEVFLFIYLLKVEKNGIHDEFSSAVIFFLCQLMCSNRYVVGLYRYSG